MPTNMTVLSDAKVFHEGNNHMVARSYGAGLPRKNHFCLMAYGIAGTAFITSVAPAIDVVVSEPVCAVDCPLQDIYGNIVLGPFPSNVATPIETTYSVQHLLGGDTLGTGQITCFSIEASPPTGAADNVVTFDNLPEAIKTHVDGVIPIVTEELEDFGGGTRTLRIITSSASGGDLFPGGQIAPNGVTPLTAACFFVGLQDPLSWEGVDTVTAGNITFFAGNNLVAGPFDLTDPPRFTDPWNGLLVVSFQNLAGQGVNRVQMEITVDKVVEGPTAACCIQGICVGDNEQESCEFQGGVWNVGATCGSVPTAPRPICVQDECAYDNGLPLDDRGAVHSQFAPDQPYGVAAADDFVLRDTGSNSCRITNIRTWVTHPAAPPGSINPGADYEGVHVTIYANDDPPSPNGRPLNSGAHQADVAGGIVLAQRFPMSAVTVTPQSAACLPDAWRLDIPVDAVLDKNVRYWLEIQPVLDDAIGRSAIMLSRNQNEFLAMEIAPAFGVLNWRNVSGNQNACPAGNPAGTRQNLAFQLFGTKAAGPSHDDCTDPIVLRDGVAPFANRGASTDGPPVPEECAISHYDQIGSDVWFKYEATCTGTVTVSTCGSGYDTKMAAYPGCGRCPVSEDPVACNEDFCGSRAQVEFEAAEGGCFTVRVGGYLGAQGSGVLDVSCEVPPPPSGACCSANLCIGTFSLPDCTARSGTWFANQSCPAFTCPVDPPPHDDCINAEMLATGEEYIRTNLGAGGLDLTSCGFNDSKDVWHKWTADCTGDAVISLCTPAAGLNDTVLAVFTACDGAELGCNDDACQVTKSLIAPEVFQGRVSVTAGTTYYIRVSGYNNATGQYRIRVLPCAGACCDSLSFNFGCSVRSEMSCITRPGGIAYAPGTTCLGDGNGNQIDDRCEGCPNAEIESVTPPDGVVDARQPHAPNSALLRQGIGSADEPIVVTLSASIRGLEDCFSICETQPDPVFGANFITQVTDLGGTDYEIVLQRPITPGQVTTLDYSGGTGFVSFTSHPANVNGDTAAAPPDILAMIDCCLNGVCVPPWGGYSCDVDHSGLAGPPDILRVIDLLNGAGDFNSWLNTSRPVNLTCP